MKVRFEENNLDNWTPRSKMNFIQCVDDEIIPFIDISDLFNLEKKENNRKLIVIKHGKQKFALIFDEIFDEYQAVIKNLGTIFNNLDFLLGVSILGNGNIAYILDTYKLLKRIQ